MDTAQEALFRAMLNGDWFTQSDGDVEWSLGFFGWVHNHPSELASIRDAFSDVIDSYGNPADEDIVGVWWADINSNGIVRISKIGEVTNDFTNTYDFARNPAVREAKDRFSKTVDDFIDWNNESEDSE